MKILNHKKGLNMPDVGEGLLAVGIGVVFFMMLFGLLSISNAEAKENVQKQQAVLGGNHLLRTFLQMPITPEFSEGNIKALANDLQGRDVHVSDLISMVNPQPENEEQLNLKKLLNDQIQMIKNQRTIFKLELVYPSGETITVDTSGWGAYELIIEEIMIPTPKPGAVIKASFQTNVELTKIKMA